VQLARDNYPILGRLTIASGKNQRLTFGMALHPDASGESPPASSE
jgi:hypothetical protein